MSTPAYDQFTQLLKRNAFAEASALAERESLSRGDKSEFWLTQQAVALNRAGNHSQALEAAEKALRLAPKNVFALLVLADALLGLSKTSEALALYEEAMSLSENPQRAQRGCLECLSRLEQWDRMVFLLSQWQMQPAAAFPWRTRALAGQGKTDEALEVCREWLKLFPDHAQALWQLTELEIRKEGLEAVMNRMGKLAKIPSRPPIYGEIYASLCRKAGKDGAALRQYENLAQRTSSPSILRKQAFALAKSGQEDKALPVFEELLRGDPKDMYVHSAYVAACTRVNGLEHAWKFYHDLLAMHPAEKGLYGRLKAVQKKLAAIAPPLENP